MSRNTKKVDPVVVKRKGNEIYIELKEEWYGRSQFILGNYLQSLVNLYKHHGVDLKFTANTQGIYLTAATKADEIANTMAVGQRLIYDGVMKMITSTATGDFGDNLNVIIELEEILAYERFEGDSKNHKLVYSERHSGDRIGRILTFKQDLVALYGADVASSACSALSKAVKREQNKPSYFHGLTQIGTRTSYLNDATIELMMIERAFQDNLQTKSSAEIKQLFPHIVAIVQFIGRRAKNNPRVR